MVDRHGAWAGLAVMAIPALAYGGKMWTMHGPAAGVAIGVMIMAFGVVIVWSARQQSVRTWGDLRPEEVDEVRRAVAEGLPIASPRLAAATVSLARRAEGGRDGPVACQIKAVCLAAMGVAVLGFGAARSEWTSLALGIVALGVAGHLWRRGPTRQQENARRARETAQALLPPQDPTTARGAVR